MFLSDYLEHEPEFPGDLVRHRLPASSPELLIRDSLLAPKKTFVFTKLLNDVDAAGSKITFLKSLVSGKLVIFPMNI